MTRSSLKTLVAEFLLIVVGVLVALAVDGWRQERSDLQLVDSYMVSLRAEMVEDTFLNRVYTDLSRERTKSIRLLLDDLDGTSPPLQAPDELLALNWAARDDAPLYVSSVLDELLSTGNARLLDAPVLSALQEVSERFTISNEVIDGLSFPLKTELPGVVPGHMKRAIRESIRSGGRWIFDDARLRAAADSLLAEASGPELASLQGWRHLPRVRSLLEEQAYSSAAYTEELQSDRTALIAALDAIRDR